MLRVGKNIGKKAFALIGNLEDENYEFFFNFAPLPSKKNLDAIWLIMLRVWNTPKL